MSAFDSGAFSTDAFSVNAFDFGAGPTPPPTPTAEAPRGQIPWLVARAPQRTKEDVHRSRVLHGIEAEVVSQVAERQAKALDLDELQKKEELLAELKLRRIEARTEHFEALAREREALIDREIAERLQEMLRKQDEDAIALMIMLAASI